jgi:uncharacterized protein (TIGR02722 family)
MSNRIPLGFFCALALFGPVAGCSKEYVRGSDQPGIDRAAMSTGLDKEDIERALQGLLDKLRSAPVMTEWGAQAQRGSKTTVAIAPFTNETSEHIEPQLGSLLEEVETWLVNSGFVRVISQERQSALVSQIEGQQHPVFDPQHIPQYGKQMGVKFFVTGNVGASDERTEDSRRVQYFIFLKVIDVETGEIRWQEKAYVTKAVK